MAWVLNNNCSPYSTWSFEIEPPEKQINLTIEERQRRGFREGYGIMDRGNTLTPELFPKRARSLTARKTFPNIISFYGFAGFSEPIVELVESLEPGVHQFAPVEVFLKDGTPATQKFYAVNIRTLIDNAIDFERSEAPFTQHGPLRRINPLREKDSGKVIIRKNAILGRHLWITEELSAKYITLSNDLFKIIRKAKYTSGYNAYELIEV